MPNETNEVSELPAGFRFAGLVCGIKASGRRDLSLIVGDRPLTVAGVYTQNQIVAAPVVLCRQRTPSSDIHAVVVNSGNANACTGQRGMEDALMMCTAAAKAVGCQSQQVLVMSTGIIGRHLPTEKITAGIRDAGAKLSASPASFADAADGILTTDRCRKVASRSLQLNGKTYRIAGMAKGAGMIAPNMATMLAVIVTDAPMNPSDAQHLLSHAAHVSFNRVSVDGHTSTNDSLLLLSSGSDDQPLLGDDLDAFATELRSLCIELAKQLPADGEGAKHVLELVVRGADSEQDAETIARAVGASPLVKTALTGGDPNWGRIVSAAGYAGPRIVPEKTSLRIMETTVFQDGGPLAFDAAELSQRMRQAVFVNVELIVGEGLGTVRTWASDLTTDYVTFNTEYTT